MLFYRNTIFFDTALGFPAPPTQPWCQLLGIHHLSEIKALAGSSVCVIAAEACARPGCLRIARCQNSNGISP